MNQKLTKLEKRWILYDVGNSAFVLLTSTIIPIYYKNIASASGISDSDSTAFFGYATSLVTILVAVLGPVLGTLADTKGFKKPVFTFFMMMGVLGCAGLALPATWVAFLAVYVLAKTGLNASLVFYDAMLPDVTADERMDVVSAQGYAWGYIGSCIPFIVSLVFVLCSDMIGISGGTAMAAAFLLNAAWWFLVTLPLLKSYEQKHYVERTPHPVRDSFGRLAKVFSEVRQNPAIWFFLLAFFLYIDGVGTIIDNCINIGTDLGLDTVGQVVVLLATQVVAWVFALIFAKLSLRYSTVKLLSVCIIGYFVVCLYAFTLKTMLQFGIMAFGVGMFQGSIQSLSRSYFTKIIPPENSGEYFGIYDIFSKGASFIGSAVIAAVKFAGGTINIAVGLMAIFFFLGFVLLRVADRKESARV